MSSLNLLTVAFSPYGQRVETLLLEKNISYNKEQILKLLRSKPLLE
jgi:hypothetical protein